jgi:transglutaminase-like putative cysteine protease
MHAWVRAWCGEAGWQEYDPTNACLVGADHIRVAIGRDYAEAAPVAGVLRLAGAQRSQQAVDVIPVGSDEA